MQAWKTWPFDPCIIVNAAINTTSYLAECEITGQTVNKRKLAINIGIGIVIDARGEGGIDGKRLRGVWKTANQKIKNSKSVKKIAIYTAKKNGIKDTVKRHVSSTFRSAILSNNAIKALKRTRIFFKRVLRKGH